MLSSPTLPACPDLIIRKTVAKEMRPNASLVREPWQETAAASLTSVSGVWNLPNETSEETEWLRV